MCWPIRRGPVSAQDVEMLADIIRKVDGNHSLGAAALAEAILGEGVEVVKLPEPDEFVDGDPVWIPVEDDADITTVDVVEGLIRQEPGGWFPVDEARSVAAALLAAARHAEAGRDE